MRTWQKWTLGIVGGLVVVVAATVIFFQWNWVRDPIANYASDKTGRKLTLGNLDATWSLRPRIVLQDVHLANADWGEAPELFSADKVELMIDLKELARGRTVIPELRLSNPKLAIEYKDDGTPNYDLAAKEAGQAVTPDTRGNVPLIGQLSIENGHLKYKDPPHALNIDGTIATVAGSGGEGKGSVHIEGQGTLQGEAFQIALTGGSLLSLREDKQPYPLKVEVKAVDSHAAIQGTLDDPMTFDGLDLKAELEGPNLAKLTKITGVPFPLTPPYKIAGRFERDGKVFQLTKFSGTMGHSDIGGDLKVDTGRERLYLEADLASKKLDYRDVGSLIGINPDSDTQEGQDKASPPEQRADAASQPKNDAVPQQNGDIAPPWVDPDHPENVQTAAGAPPGKEEKKEPKKVIPDAPLAVDQVRKVDAKLHFKAAQVEAPNVPLKGVDLTLNLDKGVMRMMPLRVDVAGGTTVADVRLDARKDVVKTDYDVKLRNFHLEDFLNSAGLKDKGSGRIDGRIRLSGTGDTLHKSLASSDGDIRLVMNNGEMSNFAMKVAGLDIARTLGTLASGDQPTPIRCLVADMGVQKGEATTRLFLLDTKSTALTADGKVDLGDEQMDWTIAAHPKEPTPLSLRTPITVKGALSQPHVGVETGPLAARAGAAVALGVLLTPVASIIAFIDPGLAKDNDCAGLLAQVQAPPGVKTNNKVEAPPDLPPK